MIYFHIRERAKEYLNNIFQEMAGVDIIDRKWKPIFRNMTRLKVFVQNLKPGAIYHFAYELRYCTQRFDGVCNTIQSEWHSAEIPCIRESNKNFMKHIYYKQ